MAGEPFLSAGVEATSSVAKVAIQRASEATGAGFDYLLKTAMRESSLNEKAQASTSSAAGLFQFIEQTWLGAVKTYGARHGLGAEASAIKRDESGKFAVSDSQTRKAILDLRFDARASAALAGELTNENESYLKSKLSRAVSAGELYAAHFLGPAGAVKMIAAGAATPGADILPAAAKANRAIFYDGDRARSTGEILKNFARSMGQEKAAEASVAPMPSSPMAVDQPGPSALSFASQSGADRGLMAMSAQVPAHQPLSFLTMNLLDILDPAKLLLDRARDERQRDR